MRIATLLLLMPALGLADVEMRFNDGLVGLVSDGRVLFGDEDNSVLFEPGESGMRVINRDERTWMLLEPGFADEMMAATRARMDEMLADLPPEQRAMVEQQMQGMMPQFNSEPPEVNVERTGDSDTVAGYDCEIAEVSYDGGDIEEIVCIASARELGIDEADYDALVSAMIGMAEIASLDPEAAGITNFDNLGGIPIRTVNTADGSTSELVSVETAAIDPARFAVPDGYREASLSDMMGM